MHFISFLNLYKVVKSKWLKNENNSSLQNIQFSFDNYILLLSLLLPVYSNVRTFDMRAVHVNVIQSQHISQLAIAGAGRGLFIFCIFPCWLALLLLSVGSEPLIKSKCNEHETNVWIVVDISGQLLQFEIIEKKRLKKRKKQSCLRTACL